MNGSRYREVPGPARTDGIGVALRRAFGAHGGAQDEFNGLLGELDRRTRM